jgi:hypothetical protein
VQPCLNRGELGAGKPRGGLFHVADHISWMYHLYKSAFSA